MKTLTVLDFFYQSTETLLRNQEEKTRILSLLEFFVQGIIAAIETFYIKKQFSEFDPQVGETLCQIRAYKILLLGNRNPHIKDIINKYREIYTLVKNSLTSFNQLKKNKFSRYNKELDKNEKLHLFLKKRNLIFDISSDIFFLALGYYLTIFCKKDQHNIPICIDVEKLNLTLGIGKASAKKFIQNFQIKMSQMCCDFILKLAINLPMREKNYYLIFSYLQLTDKNKRTVYPCYEVTYILIMHILKNKNPVVIISQRKGKFSTETTHLIFKPADDKKEFELCSNLDELNPNIPCIVIQGVTSYENQLKIESQSEFISRFISCGLAKIILCNMAKHPQYSAEEFKSLSKNPYESILNISQEKTPCNILISKKIILLKNIAELETEFYKMKDTAEKEGCCMENSSLFFIKHIFCDNLEKYLNKVDLAETPNMKRNYYLPHQINNPKINYLGLG